MANKSSKRISAPFIESTSSTTPKRPTEGKTGSELPGDHKPPGQSLDVQITTGLDHGAEHQSERDPREAQTGTAVTEDDGSSSPSDENLVSSARPLGPWKEGQERVRVGRDRIIGDRDDDITECASEPEQKILSNYDTSDDDDLDLPLELNPEMSLNILSDIEGGSTSRSHSKLRRTVSVDVNDQGKWF